MTFSITNRDDEGQNLETLVAELTTQQQDSNKVAYENGFEEYVRTTPAQVTGGMREWLLATVAGVPHDAHILELGSGTGRDADYLESLGYHVQRSDRGFQFVSLLQSQGHSVLSLDAITGDYPSPTDVILANAVACHFDQNQMATFVDKAHASLKPEGRLSFSTKLSSEYEVEEQDRLGEARFFVSWPQGMLLQFVQERGFSVLYSTSSSGIKSKSEWLTGVFEKK